MGVRRRVTQVENACKSGEWVELETGLCKVRKMTWMGSQRLWKERVDINGEGAVWEKSCGQAVWGF